MVIAITLPNVAILDTAKPVICGVASCESGGSPVEVGRERMESYGQKRRQDKSSLGAEVQSSQERGG
jgi:hypothetical protein